MFVKFQLDNDMLSGALPKYQKVLEGHTFKITCFSFSKVSWIFRGQKLRIDTKKSSCGGNKLQCLCINTARKFHTGHYYCEGTHIITKKRFKVKSYVYVYSINEG